jgi:hypothetical protein
LRGKSHEKYNSVLTRKKDIDQNYDIKMKDLAKRIKMKELNGSKMNADGLRLTQKRSLLTGSGELDVRLDELESADPGGEEYNRDVTDPFS